MTTWWRSLSRRVSDDGDERTLSSRKLSDRKAAAELAKEKVAKRLVDEQKELERKAYAAQEAHDAACASVDEALRMSLEEARREIRRAVHSELYPAAAAYVATPTPDAAAKVAATWVELKARCEEETGERLLEAHLEIAFARPLGRAGAVVCYDVTNRGRIGLEEPGMFGAPNTHRAALGTATAAARAAIDGGAAGPRKLVQVFDALLAEIEALVSPDDHEKLADLEQHATTGAVAELRKARAPELERMRRERHEAAIAERNASPEWKAGIAKDRQIRDKLGLRPSSEELANRED